MRKQTCVIAIQFARLATELVNTAVEYRAQDMLLIVSVLNEILSEPVEQRRYRRRVGLAKVVHWLDDSLSHDGSPNPVHGDAREKRIARLRQPIGKRGAPIANCRILNLAITWQPRLHGLAGARL